MSVHGRPRHPRAIVSLVGGLLVTVVVTAGARPAAAGCNLIPSTPKHFRAALGGTNRPFAGPGEIVQLGVLPKVCDQESPGLVSANPADYVVTVVFTPPGQTARRNHVVVVAPDCTALAEATRRCEARADIAGVTCVDAARPGAKRVEVTEHEGQPVLSVRFPDTDALVDGPDDGRTLTGPATIAVTTAGAPLPCELASARCAETTKAPGLLVCVDELFPQDGTCQTGRGDVDPTFGHFTALPPMNDYRTIVAMDGPSAEGPCIGSAPEVHLTVDAAGNALVPIDWRGAADGGGAGAGDPPPPRSQGSTVRTLLAHAGPITLPGRMFLTAYTPGGILLPPIFGLQTSSTDVSLFGSTDVPFTVLRLIRRSLAFRACAGGSHQGLPCMVGEDCPDGTCGSARCEGGANVDGNCVSDTDCSGSECGPALFDFRDRLSSGVGPVVIPLFAATADAPMQTSAADGAASPSSTCDGDAR